MAIIEDLDIHFHSFLHDPTPPSSPLLKPILKPILKTSKPVQPPSPPASSSSSPHPSEAHEDPQSLLISHYEILTAQLRRRIQDYEIALLRMQLRARDKELKAMLQSKNAVKAETKVVELTSEMSKQEERIERVTAEMEVWKICALEARFMLELTLGDLAKVQGGAERRGDSIKEVKGERVLRRVKSKG